MEEVDLIESASEVKAELEVEADDTAGSGEMKLEAYDRNVGSYETRHDNVVLRERKAVDL